MYVGGSEEKMVAGEKVEISYLCSEKVFPISGRHLSKIDQCALCLKLEYQIWKIQGNIKLSITLEF